jgi:hypothetical protein
MNFALMELVFPTAKFWNTIAGRDFALKENVASLVSRILTADLVATDFRTLAQSSLKLTFSVLL